MPRSGGLLTAAQGLAGTQAGKGEQRAPCDLLVADRHAQLQAQAAEDPGPHLHRHGDRPVALVAWLAGADGRGRGRGGGLAVGAPELGEAVGAPGGGVEHRVHGPVVAALPGGREVRRGALSSRLRARAEGQARGERDDRKTAERR